VSIWRKWLLPAVVVEKNCVLERPVNLSAKISFFELLQDFL
jgi:hypothetical protein